MHAIFKIRFLEHFGVNALSICYVFPKNLTPLAGFEPGFPAPQADAMTTDFRNSSGLTR
jgi:hypothetical protein